MVGAARGALYIRRSTLEYFLRNFLPFSTILACLNLLGEALFRDEGRNRKYQQCSNTIRFATAYICIYTYMFIGLDHIIMILRLIYFFHKCEGG